MNHDYRGGAMKYRDLRLEVVRVAREMSESGLVVGTSGNVSARASAESVLITPSGLPYARMKPQDVAVVDLEGNVVDGALAPSVETPMHLGIYAARPEARAIAHTHARYSTVLACMGLEIPPVHYMLAELSDEGRAPIADYAIYGSRELAENASRALGSSHRACLLRNHGTIAVGDSPQEAYKRTEILEEMAEIFYRTRLAG
ncbi:MAG: class II aldolase/adducin family protein, partial [Rubrobacteraceae bacterium]